MKFAADCGRKADMMRKALKIGKTTLEYGLMLAPMAGFSDRAMRLVAKEHGAEYCVSEMVSAKAIVYGDKKTVRLAKISPDEVPTAVQIFGSEPDVMACAAEIISSGVFGGATPAAIDINMGCPVPKIFKNGEGSALMKNPALIEKICSAAVKKTTLPVTVKIRLGIDENSKNAVECALAAEAGGAALVVVHGRTRVQMYSGEADYIEIEKVKKSLHIPVVANGDINDAERALSVLEKTGADGLMIGRGAVGNPFIFEEIKSCLAGKEYCFPTLARRAEVALHQLRLSVLDKGETVAVKEARGQIAQYLRSFKGAAALRAAINRAESYEEVVAAISSAVYSR